MNKKKVKKMFKKYSIKLLGILDFHLLQFLFKITFGGKNEK